MNRRSFLSKLGLGCLVAPSIVRAISTKPDYLDSLAERTGTKPSDWFIDYDGEDCLYSIKDNDEGFSGSVIRHLAKNNPWNDLFPK